MRAKGNSAMEAILLDCQIYSAIESTPRTVVSPRTTSQRGSGSCDPAACDAKIGFMDIQRLLILIY